MNRFSPLVSCFDIVLRHDYEPAEVIVRPAQIQK